MRDGEQELARLVEEHLEELLVRSYSPQGLKSRRYGLAKFTRWCQEQGVSQAKELDEAFLWRYQKAIEQHRTVKGQSLRESTIRGLLAMVQVFCHWLVKRGLLVKDPGADLGHGHRRQTIPRRVLSEAEAEAVLKMPDIGTPLGLRNRAMLETLYSTGLRCGELTKLGAYDLDHGQGLVMVREGKGRKDRMVAIGERALYWVGRYLTDARPHLTRKRDSGELFVSFCGRTLTRGQVTLVVGRYVRESGVSKEGACHLFRHTMATLMLEHGADLRYIQAMLGHVEISTTQVYTRVAIGKLKEIHRRTHPAERMARGEPGTSTPVTAPARLPPPA